MIKHFFKILGEYTIILGMENGFVMIEKFKKFVGQYIKEKEKINIKDKKEKIK